MSGASRENVKRGAEDLRAPKPVCSSGTGGNYAVYPKGFPERSAHALTIRVLLFVVALPRNIHVLHQMGKKKNSQKLRAVNLAKRPD